MRVIVAGSRDFTDFNRVEIELKRIFVGLRPSQVEIVSGAARGADSLGEQFAEKYKCQLKRFPAQWDKNGKSAGFIRNEEMAKYADMCVVFWDGVSKGSKHMIDLAGKHGIPVHTVMIIEDGE